jgi:single-stranded-DNA-specific exonuclease
VYNALEACAEHLERLVGTCMPGMTGEENYLFKELVKGRTIHPDMLIPKITIDAEIDF